MKTGWNTKTYWSILSADWFGKLDRYNFCSLASPPCLPDTQSSAVEVNVQKKDVQRAEKWNKMQFCLEASCKTILQFLKMCKVFRSGTESIPERWEGRKEVLAGCSFYAKHSIWFATEAWRSRSICDFMQDYSSCAQKCFMEVMCSSEQPQK